MGAAHSADGNLSSFFLGSSKGVPPAVWIFSLGSALTEQQQSFCAWIKTCFITGCSTPHLFSPEEGEDWEPIHPCVSEEQWRLSVHVSRLC